jgi:hypothetical protein
MSKKSDYVPKKDADFDVWLKQLCQYVALKTSGTNAERSHIPKEATEKLDAAYADWYTHYSLTLKPHTPAETLAKNLARKRAEKVARPFVNQYLKFEPVTDADRVNISIHNKDTILTPIPKPPTRPAFTLRAYGNRVVRIDFWDEGASTKARPYGYDGAIVHWALLDEPPARPDDLASHFKATKRPYDLEFSEDQRGKTLYVALRWENDKGDLGPWSDILSTIVP